MKAEEDNANALPTGEGGDFTKIEVEGQEDSALGNGSGENLFVGGALHSHVTEMGSVVAVLPQPADDTHIHAHVGEKAHSAPYEMWTCSWASQAAYSIACWMSSRSRSG